MHRSERRALFLPSYLLLFLDPLRAQSSNELEIGTAAAREGSVATIPLRLSTTDEVQGLVMVFEWDGKVGTGVSLTAGAALLGADTLVTRVEADYMVLGMVVDSDGDPPSFIGPGKDLDIGKAEIRCAAGLSKDTTTPLVFADNEHAAASSGPPLENLVSVGGLSIGKDQGLVLTPGSLTCRRIDEGVIYEIEDAVADAKSGCGDARILMTSGVPVEGFEVAVSHPAALLLESVEAGAAAISNGADFKSGEVLAAGGTLGVVMDLMEPFLENVIPPGENLHIGTYRYCCKTRPASTPAVHDLRFVDNVLGAPPRENTVVSSGGAIAPELRNGTFTCPPAAVPEDCDDGIDNDGDGLVDANDSDCVPPGQMFACGGKDPTPGGDPPPARGEVGGTVEVCFYYKSPEDNAPGHEQFDQVQGLSMAVCYPCDLQCREGSFDTTGTIVESVGADFVSFRCDNTAGDGDGCEFTLGILVDSLPPFDGITLPPTDIFLSVGCVTFDVADREALCGECLPITFCDGADAPGGVPIKNLVSVENKSRPPMLMNCEVCLQGEPRFYRGDCNFMPMGMMSVDIADAAAVISFLFGQGDWKFNPPCLDACDCNDDGRIDLADSMCILKFLFQAGSFPPPPGPGFDMMIGEVPQGPDPTEDKLGCEGGGEC